MKLIHDSWANKVVGCPMFILQHKLKRLKIDLRDWNKNFFSNVHNVVLLKQGLLLGIEQTFKTVSLSDIDGLLCQENIAKEELDHALHCQYLFWKERAKMLWFKDGDRNTDFFHVVVKRRNNSSGIHRLQIYNEVIEDPKLIQDHILDFYKNLYAKSISNVQDTSNMEDFIGTYIPKMVSSEENMMLIKCPNFLEIKNVVFNLNGNSAPGPNGFGSVFYHSCWEIIGIDVCNVIQQIFKQNWVLPGMNSNVVSLIPKIHGHESIKAYRPIVVASFKFKIISKILAYRIAPVAARIISPNQYGFVKGRQVQDCIGIAFEAINMLSKKVIGGNVSYKVDIHKSFGTRSWKFLLLVLTRYGFHPLFVGWISTILRSAMVSIRINGNLVGFFTLSKGVKQSDPLSPLLFCLVDKVFSRGISKLVNDKKILHMASPQGYLTPSHILYVDDIFFFCRTDIKSLRNLSIFLKTYGDFSGQHVNNS